MQRTTVITLSITGLLVLWLFSACNSASQESRAALTVETYLQALVARDFNKMANASCAAWEAQAKVEFDSFAAVKLNLKDLACKEIGQEESFKLVSCTGSIIANYGAEDLEINIADRIYKTSLEGGDWLMCGYK